MWKKAKKIIRYFATVATLLINTVAFLVGINTWQQIIDWASFSNIWELFKSYPVMSTIVVAYILVSCVLLFELPEFHYNIHEFYHRLRDSSFSIQAMETPTSHKDFYFLIRESSQVLSNKLRDSLADIFKKDFCVYLYTLDLPSREKEITDEDAKDIKVKLLCASGKNSFERTNPPNPPVLNPFPIKADTAFYKILIERKKTVFKCGNIPVYKWTQKILHKEYSQIHHVPKYRSRIVIPIRISRNALSAENEKTTVGGYQVLGFLSVEYKYFLTSFKQKEMLPYLKAFADGLYVFFSSVCEIDGKICEKERMSL